MPRARLHQRSDMPRHQPVRFFAGGGAVRVLCQSFELMHMHSAPDVPLMRLVCFVGPDRPEPLYVRRTGYDTLPRILAMRPESYRYAVVEVCDGSHMTIVWLVDMLDLRTTPDLNYLGLGWHKEYPDHDTAIMAATMRRPA